MRPMLSILSLVIGAIGWYYLFYSQAAMRLGSIEDQRQNRLRGALRRINAIVMLLMAVGIATGTYKFDKPGQESAFILIWSGVMILLLLFMILALIDLRLTWKLRQSLRERKRP